MQLVVHYTQLVLQLTRPVVQSTQPVGKLTHPVEELAMLTAVPAQQLYSPTQPAQQTAQKERRHGPPVFWPTAGPSPIAITSMAGPETVVLWAQVTHLEGLVTALSA